MMALDNGNIYISNTYPPGVQVWAPGATSGELMNNGSACAASPNRTNSSKSEE